MAKLRDRAIAGLLFAVLATAGVGCGDSGEDAASGSGTGAASTAADSADDAVAKAQEIVDKATAVPEFTPPGPAFDASKAKGKVLFDIPLNSSIPTAALKLSVYKEIAKKIGFKFVDYPNQGQPSDWVQGMNTAIAQKADLIVLDGSPNPKLLEPQIKQARDAGIPVLVTHYFDETSEPPTDIDAIVPAPFNLSGKLEANWVIADSGGKAGVLVVQASDAPPSAGILKTIQDEFAAACPDTCKTTVVDVPVVDWTTKTQGEVQSALVRDPNINYVLPMYDAMAPFAAAAVVAGGATGSVKIGSFNGTPSVLKMIQDGSPVAMDAGENPEWLAYANMDQALRMLAGEEPVKTENTPIRIFTKDNVDDAGTPPELGKGYGDAYKSGYEALWGLK